MCQGGSGVPISCGQFKGNFWTEKDTRTWNGLEAGNSSLGSPVSVTYGNGNSQRKLSDKDQWYNWNVTGIVKKWINDISLKEKGLQFRTYTSFLEENSIYSDYMKTFSSMQGNASYRPYFVIKYKINGCRGYSGEDSINVNCLLFATDSSTLFRFYERLYSDSFLYFYLTDKDIENIVANKNLSYALAKTRQHFQQWLEKYFKGRWRSISSDVGYKAVLDDNEWLICMRVGLTSEQGFDYHFWYRANDGVWYNKHGWNSPSEPASDNVNPSTDNSASGWTLNNKTFYNSDTVYYAVKKN